MIEILQLVIISNSRIRNRTFIKVLGRPTYWSSREVAQCGISEDKDTPRYRPDLVVRVCDLCQDCPNRCKCRSRRCGHLAPASQTHRLATSAAPSPEDHEAEQACHPAGMPVAKDHKTIESNTRKKVTFKRLINTDQELDLLEGEPVPNLVLKENAGPGFARVVHPRVGHVMNFPRVV